MNEHEHRQWLRDPSAPQGRKLRSTIDQEPQSGSRRCGLRASALIAPRIRGAINRALIGRYVCSWTLEDVERYLSNTSNLLTHSLEAQAESEQTARVIDGAALVAIETELRRRKRAAQQTRRGGIPTIVNENAVAR